VAQPATWLEVSIAVDHEAVEAVCEILSRAATAGVSVEPAFAPLDEGLAASLDSARPVLVRAWLPDAEAAATADALGRVRTALGHLQAFGLRPIGELRTAVVRDADWAAQGRAHFPVLRIGQRFVVRPTWRRYRPRSGDMVLALDPGVAFGTGLHPTTQLCLLGLEAWGAEGRVARARVLDVGAGSGILSLGAARLGAAAVLGVDTDPLAAEATAASARRNRLSHTIRSRTGTVPTGEAPFDLVLANLVASVLAQLAAALYAEVRRGDGTAGSGGRLLAGGVISPREVEVRRAFAAAGFHLLRRWEDGDWVAIEAERVD